ncbi:MAG: enoyl-CoA hydratase/isomerase family protein [Actinomycetales bacterium]|nr:enoyl-CoA hydratase/isomerase family protein [Actinomycetales bacterium]
MAAEPSGVRVERAGDVVHVILDRPEVRNAQTPATWRALAEVPDQLTVEDRAVVLRGEGVSFSAGLDRRMLTPDGVPGEESLLTLASYDDAEMDAFIQRAQAAFTWWRSVPQVTIALVQGHAIGAGFQLALACDLMVVAPDAQLAMRETSLGLVPDLGGTGPLVDRVGYSRAFEICATGRFVTASEAVALGIATVEAAPGAWADLLELTLAPIRAALPGAVGELKALLGSAAADPAQLERERAAQIRRLTELRALMGG